MGFQENLNSLVQAINNRAKLSDIEPIGDLIANSSSHVPLSGVTSYHLLSGSLTLANSVITNGFATTLYTGNGTSQSVVTDVDMATQWGNDASETFGGLVWGKSRSYFNSHNLCDTIRGVGNFVFTDLTNAQFTVANRITSFNSNGFSLGTDNGLNNNLATYASWVFQTTHRITGTTNHGKAYTCHYNPYTGFTIVKYEGSGLAGHEIPHHLGRKLGLYSFKCLNSTPDWQVNYDGQAIGNYLSFSTTHGDVYASNINMNNNDKNITLSVTDRINFSGNTYIMYGWANSYFDEANTLIGNYEIGIYQGTGASGNKVTTRGKPAWVMTKRLDSTSNWNIHDNMRIPNANGILYPNGTSAESNVEWMDIITDGFTINSTSAENNASGGQYLYMVVYDNDSGSGKSKYPRATDTSTLNLNATIPFANGIDASGTKNSILSKNETVSGLTFTQGKNYVYSDNTGAYGVMSVAPTYSNVNPANGGDFYNVLENKWYTSAGTEITESRNYLDAIVYADAGGQPTYVEQLPKTEYKDIVKANEYQGKNACTAWVNFDGTTTPPTIRDSYNVKSVVRISTGMYEVYFEKQMDSANYSISGSKQDAASVLDGHINAVKEASTVNKLQIQCIENNAAVNSKYIDIQIFGGRN